MVHLYLKHIGLVFLGFLLINLSLEVVSKKSPENLVDSVQECTLVEDKWTGAQEELHDTNHNISVASLSLMLLVLVLLIVGFSVYPLYKRLSRLSKISIEVSLGNFDVRIPAYKGKETEALAEGMRVLVKRIKCLLEGQRTALRIVAHECRTPMMRIQFLLEEMKCQSDPATTNLIEHELAEINLIFSDLSRYMYVSSGTRVDVVPERFALDRLIFHLTLSLVKQRPEVKINVNCVGELIILQDKRLTKYVLRNLIENAIKWTATEVTVHARLEDELLYLEIIDDGPGVHDRHPSQIFEPFIKDPKNGGMGLGLAIVRHIVIEQLNGLVEAQNAEGGGFRVICKIPLNYL